MQASFIDSIHLVDAHLWNSLCGAEYPFCRYEFLATLEDTFCTSPDTGWQIAHLLVHEQGQLIAAMPGYVKTHSYGEYVFDWAWADLYHRHGVSYYPKWINAIPFTPCSGPRLLVKEKDIHQPLLSIIHSSLKQLCKQHHYSGWHSLFPNVEQSTILMSAEVMQRKGCQFHWFNKNYQNFDEFLARMTSRKRKNIIKERRQVDEQNFEFNVKEGSQLSDDDMVLFYELYRNTYLKRSGHSGYLSQEFFYRLGKVFKDHLVLICALNRRGEQKTVIAAALFFRDQNTLYGRYWGCFAEYQFLHFETCYYQGIDYAISKGLQRFDGGAQGEHKIPRGFEPVITYSNHYLEAAGFRQVIANFLQQEGAHIHQYIADARALLPFKQDQ